MTPAEHYATAERLIRLDPSGDPDDLERSAVALAQVHATLASCNPAVVTPALPQPMPLTQVM